MPPEAVMTVGGLVIRPVGLDQQSCATQQVEQSIAPELDAFGPEAGIKQVFELSRAQTWMAHALIFDALHHLGYALATPFVSRHAFVMCLPANTHMPASPAHAHAFDAFVLQDLPEGFFVRRTPYSVLITSSMASNN
jgi:hypothetical protein